ncbi:hypothetical protein EIP91_002829 [Steccherinum ochraceum]|uniref:Prolyl 4-hydroxylase alpha subunit Fe(2+) 2OG dioxygenase domain-containing protein n=1 Tax=Steccherinum ochraceum TaxID=92696 RepID=A0A4R0RS53_9APHY|nr:hypothetical protein EIP91_002829 [Steccherinum ochraceum]
MSGVSDFEVEHTLKAHGTPPKTRRRRTSSDYSSEAAYRARVARLLNAKARPFSVCGRIPVDPANLILFFRSKSGITHSLDFPIDIDHDLPPSLEVLIAACRPHSPSGLEEFSVNDSLFYPHNLPITTTLEIANHPILDAVRNTLFPTLPTGHYLTTLRDKAEIWLKGGGMKVQPRPNDTRVATILVTLPVRFRGGALVVRSMDGSEEKFYGRGGKPGDMEWAAFMADCDHEVEPVQKGCRMSISYGVYLRTFGTAEINPDPLISPSDNFLDMVSPILNMSRGRKVAFYLCGEYGVNPGEVLADSLVPDLKGGDSILYHALKLYKLSPELRWTAGGYIWALDQVVDLSPSETDEEPQTATTGSGRIPFAVLNGTRPQAVASPLRTSFSTASSSESGEDDMRTRVKKSGAVSLSDAEIVVLSDSTLTAPISKERVFFVQGGELEKLVVNIMLVVYVP